MKPATAAANDMGTFNNFAHFAFDYYANTFNKTFMDWVKLAPAQKEGFIAILSTSYTATPSGEGRVQITAA
jgi:hypothetical protein